MSINRPITVSQRCGVFARLARVVAQATGHPWCFGAAFAVIVVWAALGPVFRFSDTWQLVINTAPPSSPS